MVSGFTAFMRPPLRQSSGHEWWLGLSALDIFLYVLVIVLGHLRYRILIRLFDVEKGDEVAYKELVSHDVTFIKGWLLEARSAVFQANERLVSRKKRYWNCTYDRTLLPSLSCLWCFSPLL